MRTATKGMLLGAFVVLVVYDVVAYAVRGNDSTISVFALQFAKDWPIAAVLFGVVTGHLFWPQRAAAPAPLSPAEIPWEPGQPSYAQLRKALLTLHKASEEAFCCLVMAAADGRVSNLGDALAMSQRALGLDRGDNTHSKR